MSSKILPQDIAKLLNPPVYELMTFSTRPDFFDLYLLHLNKHANSLPPNDNYLSINHSFVPYTGRWLFSKMN